LFGEVGCYTENGKPNRECGKADTPRHKVTAERETPLDPAYYPLTLTDAQDNAWYDIVKANIIVNVDVVKEEEEEEKEK